MAKDYYEILQIHPSAEPEVIRAAYRRLIQKYHPDKNPVELALAERRTQEITEAYAVLSNPEQRSRYDRARTPGPDNAQTEAERRKASTEMESARKAKAEAQQAQRRAEEARRQAEARAREADEARRRAEARAWQAEADSRAQQAAAEAQRRTKASRRRGFGATGWLTLGMAAFGLAMVAWGIVYLVMQGPPAETAKPQETRPAVASAESRPAAMPTSRANPVPCADCPPMVKLSGGRFAMGAADDDEDAGPGEKPRHPVEVRPFAIGQTEVTQRLWVWVMGDNPSYQQGCMDCPVEKVSHADIEAFLLRLNVMTGQNFRLPSEAEWEYACRGGAENQTYCGGGEDPAPLAWHNRNADGVRKVKSKQANAFGLYDMSGNVWEWCQDYWHDSYDGAPPGGAAWMLDGNADYRVVRGGAWSSKPQTLRAAARQRSNSSKQFNYLGFRLAQDNP